MTLFAASYSILFYIMFIPYNLNSHISSIAAELFAQANNKVDYTIFFACVGFLFSIMLWGLELALNLLTVIIVEK